MRKLAERFADLPSVTQPESGGPQAHKGEGVQASWNHLESAAAQGKKRFRWTGHPSLAAQPVQGCVVSLGGGGAHIL